jgi:hypothetical protein
MFPLEKSLMIGTIKTRSQNQAHVILRLRHGIFTAPDLGEKERKNKQNKTQHNKTNHRLDMDHHNASSFTEFSVMQFLAKTEYHC